MHNLIKDSVRTLEESSSPDVIADGIGMNVFYWSGDLGIPETMIAEYRVPFCFALTADIDILGACITEVSQIKRAVRIQLLGIFHADGIARLTIRGKGYPTRHILTEVVDTGSEDSGFGRKGSHRHPGRHLGTECTERDFCALCLHPPAVIISYPVPSRQFLAGIVFLTVVFVVGSDRSVGCHLPFLVGRDTFRGAVGKGNQYIYPAFWQSEHRSLVWLVLPHREKAAIAQHDTNAVLSR